MPGDSFGKLEVEGLRTLNWKLGKLKDKSLSKELRAEYKEVAKTVSEEAKTGPVVPIVTGKLAKSIGPIVSQSSIGVKAGTNARVRYAGPVHFGWPARNQTAQPFLYAAVNVKEESIESLLEDGINRILAQYGLNAGTSF